MTNQAIVSYRTLYQQIKDALLERIVAGEWPPGTFIPSESALANEYSVSVGTLRKALDVLAAEQVVLRHQGKGTVVATHDSDRSLFQFFHLVRLDGKRSMPVSRVLTRERRAATPQEAECLGLTEGGAVVHIQRVRELEEEPSLLEDLVVSAERFRDLEHEPHTLPNTLYQLYQQRFNQTVAHAEDRIFAMVGGKEEQRRLGVPPGTPLLEIHRIAKDLQGNPLEFRVSRCETRNHYYLNEL
jgi:GntR family transcriptional regulator